MFIKEDEDLYPEPRLLPRRRADQAGRGRRSSGAKTERGGLGLLYSPHVSAGLMRSSRLVHAVPRRGRLGRDVQRELTLAGRRPAGPRRDQAPADRPPAIYGHNAGIGVKTRRSRSGARSIDFLARLDGIDFRQTGPVCGLALPTSAPTVTEWRASGRRTHDRSDRGHQSHDDHPRRRAGPR